MEILKVENLCKKYEKFTLNNVSFQLDAGYIMGFIGRNGAGKTTTLKSMLNLVHADSGQVTVLGQDFFTNELSCKQKIGFMFGGINYYPKERIKNIAGVVKRFYADWDDALFRDYLERFELEPDKKADQLSDGMRVKFALALALSHGARLLILDEPTSGLDPVSRDDLLGLFQELIEDGDKSILFSTHITSDLEKCADFITYIKDGEIIASTEKDAFLEDYRIVSGTKEQLVSDIDHLLIGCRPNAFGFSAMMRKTDLPAAAHLAVAPADLESIMIHLERK
ncbi:MAG: ABC transporter ATP-binding protein [Bacillota bacterium]|nr:ABC transporter ATP-binding protein [Bacillota bacterium]